MKRLSKQSLVTLVELPPTLFGVLNGEISFDIYSASKMPGRAVHVLEGILREDGWENTKSINPVFSETKGKLTSSDFKRIFSSDALLISSITRTSPQSQELARLYKLNKPDGIIIAGGPDPTFRYDDWMNYVDIVVIGEGEKTISGLMTRLTKHPESVEDIKGIVYKKGKEVVATPQRELLTSEELSALPHPYYDDFVRKRISAGVVETSRGCPNDCDFCTVTKVYGRKYRTKSLEYVLEELRRTRDIGKCLFFSDDNLIAVPKKSRTLFEAMTETGLNKKYSGAQTTVRVADYPELMDSMLNAGIKALCIGIESINDETLEDLGKPYTATQNKEAVRKLKEAGFWIHGMMMVGGKGDTPESLRETVNWANQNLDSAQFFSPIPIPGTPLYDKMEEESRILTKQWHLYDGNHVILRPENFTPHQLQETIYSMYRDFYSFRKSMQRLRTSKKRALAFGIWAYTQFKGRKMLYNPQSNHHLEFLKSLS